MRFPRMLQQATRFTLHLRGAIPLEVLVPETFGDESDGRRCDCRGYDILAGAKKDLRSQLRRLNVHWASLFPEMDYVAKGIRASLNLFP